LVPDRAAVAFGGDILRIGAFPEWHCDGGAFVGEPLPACHRPDRQLFAVADQASDEFSGLASALLRDPVVAHSGRDLLVAHERH